MSDYFIILDAAFFEGQFRPAMSASRRLHSFEPCRGLCAALLPAARDYAERYHTGADKPLIARVAEGLAYDRTLWRAIVGEILIYAALDMPEFQTCEESLVRLLAPGVVSADSPREMLPPILQAHRGSRDLTFGAAVYRPDHCGLNDAQDVARLAEYLASLQPQTWTAEQLAGDAEELEFVREWFPALVDLFLKSALAERCRGT